ncbi:MAG: 5'-3' exonuclease [Clostridia bacterium]|nr:5'-3' exonuclease [Clostridia bacterium]
MDKLLIVDGSALLFQSFYGMPKRIKNEKEQYVEAVVCFMGILFKTIRILSPNKLLVVFDGENALERQNVVGEYKANRIDYRTVGDEDSPFPQLEIIKVVLTYLNFKWIETSSCEADDLIASIVNDYKDKYNNIVISSPDKDFFQLICENVHVFNYRGKVSKLWTEQAVVDKYGFEAQYFSSFKALYGDQSDNIAGIKGIGLKTASNLIKQFGSLVAVYDNLHLLKKHLQQTLIENKQQAFQNYSIIQLHDKTNLFVIDDLDFNLLDTISSTNVLRKLEIL